MSRPSPASSRDSKRKPSRPRPLSNLHSPSLPPSLEVSRSFFLGLPTSREQPATEGAGRSWGLARRRPAPPPYGGTARGVPDSRPWRPAPRGTTCPPMGSSPSCSTWASSSTTSAPPSAPSARAARRCWSSCWAGPVRRKRGIQGEWQAILPRPRRSRSHLERG
uniref:Similar to RECQSIM (Arabidopsis RecQ helicase sim) n=1 Tax=Arundo donax TaxID=35708 RepID=A0A0A9DVJ6_ARUDO